MRKGQKQKINFAPPSDVPSVVQELPSNVFAVRSDWIVEEQDTVIAQPGTLPDTQPFPDTAVRESVADTPDVHLAPRDGTAVLDRAVAWLQNNEGNTRLDILVMAVVALATGVMIGFFILGQLWLLRPPTSVPYSDLEWRNKVVAVRMASNLMAYDNNSPIVMQMASLWPEMDNTACYIAANTRDQADAARMLFLAYRLNGVGCAAPDIGIGGE